MGLVTGIHAGSGQLQGRDRRRQALCVERPAHSAREAHQRGGRRSRRVPAPLFGALWAAWAVASITETEFGDSE